MPNLTQWLTDWLILRTPVLKPRTVESYADLIRRHIAPSIGGIDLQELRNTDIAHFLATVSASGRTRTAELIYVMLKAALRDLEPNPMRQVPRPLHTQTTPVAWTDEQTAVYLRALDGHPHRLPLLLALMMGLRRGEICGLRWEDIDFSRWIIHIRNQRQRLNSGEIIDCSPKSASSMRTIPVPEPLRRPLSASRQLSGYITRLTPSGLDAAHRRLTQRLEIPYTPLHGLRHTFATSCIRHGGEMKSLQLLLGHADYATTANRYTHPDIEMLQTAIALATNPCYNVLQ